MNIYILTENNYLLSGVAHYLIKKNWTSVTRFPIESPQATKLIDICSDGDVFIIDMDIMHTKFSIIKKIHDRKCTTVVIKNRSSLILMKPFYTKMFPGIFNISELNEILITTQKPASGKRRKKNLITPQERTVLGYFVKGCSVSRISEFLEISQKSIYAHQRSLCNKLGIRRSCDIAALPNGFMEYLSLDID